MLMPVLIVQLESVAASRESCDHGGHVYRAAVSNGACIARAVTCVVLDPFCMGPLEAAVSLPRSNSSSNVHLGKQHLTAYEVI